MEGCGRLSLSPGGRVSVPRCPEPRSQRWWGKGGEGRSPGGSRRLRSEPQRPARGLSGALTRPPGEATPTQLQQLQRLKIPVVNLAEAARGVRAESGWLWAAGVTPG